MVFRCIVFYTAAKACAGTCAPEHAGLYCFSWCLCWYHVWKIHTSRGSTSAMIHRSCGFAARPMDHATGENLFMIDFRRYLYQFTTKFSIQLNFVCIAPSRAAAVKRLDRHASALHDFWTCLKPTDSWPHDSWVMSLMSGNRHTTCSTVKLSRTKLRTLRLLVLGGIIENQNSDFATP